LLLAGSHVTAFGPETHPSCPT